MGVASGCRKRCILDLPSLPMSQTQKNKLYSFDDITGDGDVIDPFGGHSAGYRAVEKQLRSGMDKILRLARSEVGQS